MTKDEARELKAIQDIQEGESLLTKGVLELLLMAGDTEMRGDTGMRIDEIRAKTGVFAGDSSEGSNSASNGILKGILQKLEWEKKIKVAHGDDGGRYHIAKD